MEEGTVSWLTVYYQLGSKVLHVGLAGARHSAQAYPVVDAIIQLMSTPHQL